MEDNLNRMLFSQNSLEIFRQCRMKFKKRYIDGLYWNNVVSGSQEAVRTEKGRLFHLLAYRYLMGLDCSTGDMGVKYTELDGWIENLKNFIMPSDSCIFYPEYELKLSDDILKLQAKYDLISVERGGKVVIYDWKVHDKPLNRKRLENSYQTILYRYLLVRSGEIIEGKKIVPENVSMVYWQPTHPLNAVKIGYSAEQYQEDEQFLKEEINRILNCNFAAENLKTIDPKTCSFCEYCALCNDFMPDMNAISMDLDFELDWDEIEEIEF